VRCFGPTTPTRTTRSRWVPLAAYVYAATYVYSATSCTPSHPRPGIRTLFTKPGSPRESESIESFKGKVRAELLTHDEGEVGGEAAADPSGPPTAPEAGVV
jgi:hypothetical protein